MGDFFVLKALTGDGALSHKVKEEKRKTSGANSLLILLAGDTYLYKVASIRTKRWVRGPH